MLQNVNVLHTLSVRTFCVSVLHRASIQHRIRRDPGRIFQASELQNSQYQESFTKRQKSKSDTEHVLHTHFLR